MTKKESKTETPTIKITASKIELPTEEKEEEKIEAIDDPSDLVKEDTSGLENVPKELYYPNTYSKLPDDSDFFVGDAVYVFRSSGKYFVLNEEQQKQVGVVKEKSTYMLNHVVE